MLEALPLPPDDRARPLPAVRSFDNATAIPSQVIEALITAGGVVIKNAVSPSDLAQIESDTRKYIDGGTELAGNFFPQQTRTVTGLASRSKTFMDKIVQHPTYQKICADLLTSTHTNWVGEAQRTCVSKPQLNSTVIFSIGPGARAQQLHRDDAIHHSVTRQMLPSEYTIGQDLGIGWFVAGKKTTRANGATRFIPGSHLWDPATKPSEDLAYYAELEPGDAFIMLSSCFHGGSSNTTSEEERLVYCCFMIKGFLRQVGTPFLPNSAHFNLILADALPTRRRRINT